jgi:predicted  nucleic acid-binding Zn-ribbon protein
VTVKTAVPPVHPNVLKAVIPDNWRDAFAMMADRLMRVIGAQAGKIAKLSAELEDMNGKIAAGSKAHAEFVDSTMQGFHKFNRSALVEDIDANGRDILSINEAIADIRGLIKISADARANDLKTLNETTAIAKGTCDYIDRSVKPALQDQAETLADLLTGRDDTWKRFAAVEVAGTELAGRVEQIAADVKTLDGRTAGAVDALARQAGDIRDHAGRLVELARAGERVENLAGTVAAFEKARNEDRAVLDELAGTVKATGERLDAESAARAAAIGKLGEQVEEYAATASEADGQLSMQFDAVEKAGAELVARVNTMAADLGAVGDRLDLVAKDGATNRGNIEHTDAAVTALTVTAKAAGERLDELRSDHETLTVTVDKAGESIIALTGRAARADEQFTRLDDLLTASGAAVARITVEVGALDALVKSQGETVSGAVEASSDACRRVTIALNEIPSGMMIDRDGDLVRVNRAGEMTKLGKVVGLNGRDAADIVSVKVEDNRFVFVRSDRTELGCRIPVVEPVKPADTVDPRKLGYLSKDAAVRAVQVADMVTMRSNNKRYKLIAEKYGISERQVARLIKDAQDEKTAV